MLKPLLKKITCVWCGGGHGTCVEVGRQLRMLILSFYLVCRQRLLWFTTVYTRPVGHLTIVTVSKRDSYNYLPLANWPSCFLVFIGKASLFKCWILVFKNECAAEDHVGFRGPIAAGICVSVCVATVGHVDARDLCCSLKPCWCPWAVLQLGAVLM